MSWPAEGFAGIGVAVAVSTALVGCSAPGGDSAPSPAAAVRTSDPAMLQPPNGLGLAPVTLPDFSAMEEAVRAQMEGAHAALAARIDDPRSTSAALGAVYGLMGRLLMAATHFDAAEACYQNAETLVPRRLALALLSRSRLAGEGTARGGGRGVRASARPRAERCGDVDLARRSPPRQRAAGVGGTGARPGDDAGSRLGRDPDLHYALGMAYRGLGDLEQAQAHLARVRARSTRSRSTR